MKKLFFLIALIHSLLSLSQTANSLMQLHKFTDEIAINAIISPNEGSVVYNEDDKKVYYFDGTNWIKISTEQSVYTGFFVLEDSSGTSSSFTQTISGLPFQPSQVTFVAHANVESITLNSDNDTSNNNTGISNSFGTMNGFAIDDGGTTPVQQVIYVGGSGNSINDISRYASNSNCIGVRYGNQNGDNLGIISASLTTFTNDGFDLSVSRTNTSTNENLVILYTAYK